MTAVAQPTGKIPDRNRELLLWRLLFAIFLAITSVALRLTAEHDVPASGLGLTLLVLFFSLGATWWNLRSGISSRLLLSFQIGADAICIAVLVQLFGPQSAVPLLFVLPILASAYYLGRRAAVVLAAVASVLTGGGHAGYALGWLVNGSAATLDAARGQPVMVTAMLILLFLLLGVVGGQVSERYTERRRLQEQAAAQALRARSEVRNILDNIQSGLLILDQNGLVTRTNPAAAKILGIDSDSVVGRPIADALGPDKAEFAACVEGALSGQKPLARHELTIDRLGEEIPIGVSVSHLEDRNHQMVGVIAIFQDLTDVIRMRKRIREADRLAGIGELAASIAHEIRNPLGSIRGCVEILVGELDLEGQHAQLLELILKESARVNTIINEFLNFARLRPANRVEVVCGDLLETVALQIRQHVTVNGGSVQVIHRTTPSDLKALLDPEQMVQLFLNLAINACEAMEYAGELAIVVEKSRDGHWCQMKVQDTGPGVSAEARADLFKPFVTTKKTGTGLGLPMVARIAHAHDGSVEVREAPDGGAIFCVKVPLAIEPRVDSARKSRAMLGEYTTAAESTLADSTAGLSPEELGYVAAPMGLKPVTEPTPVGREPVEQTGKPQPV